MKNFIFLILLILPSLVFSQKIRGVDQVDDADADPVNELQTIDISGDTLYIDRANFALLNPYLDNTNVDTTFLDNRISTLESDIITKLVWADTLAGANRLATGWDIAQLSLGVTSDWSGVTNKPAGFADDIDNVDDADADPTNELFDSTFIDGRISVLEGAGYLTAEVQDISLNVNDLAITGGSTIDLSGYLDDTVLDESTVDGYANNNGYLTAEVQDLTLVGNTLAISGDPNTDVDLSPYLDNTDTQLNEAQVDAFADNNGYLEWSDTLGNLATLFDITSSEFDSTYLAYRVHLLESTNDVDSIIGNELQNIGWTDVTNYLLITQGTGTSITGFADSTLVATHTDTLGVHTDSITNLHLRMIDVENSTVNDLDIDPANEIQGLTLIGDQLDISIDSDPPIDLSGYDNSGINLSSVISNGSSAATASVTF